MERIAKKEFLEALNIVQIGSIVSSSAPRNSADIECSLAAEADNRNGVAANAQKENPVNSEEGKQEANEPSEDGRINVAHKVNEKGAESVEENAFSIRQSASYETIKAEELNSRKTVPEMVKECLELYGTCDQITENVLQHLFSVAEECELRQMSLVDSESCLLVEMSRIIDENMKSVYDVNSKKEHQG